MEFEGDIVPILKANMRQALEYIAQQVRTELEEQGHKASGNLIDSVKVVVEGFVSGKFKGHIEIADYYKFVDTGTRPHRPPYKAIYEWSKHVKPSLGQKERKSFSFAVIENIAQQGTPTSGSFEFSANGRRTEFSKYAIDQNLAKFQKMLDLFNTFRTLTLAVADRIKKETQAA